MKYLLFFLCFCTVTIGVAQETTTTYRSKKVAVRDTIRVDTVSINASFFEIFDTAGKKIDSTAYTIDYKTGTLLLAKGAKVNDSITINYLKYPQFLTRDYYTFDPSLIIKNTGAIDRLYSLEQGNNRKVFKPFDGLNTVGSISRGVTVGNNQNAVVSSELDLQITGKLNDKVSIRASIQDANIPTQQGGYSQSLDEFDQIFIELYSDDWNIRAGDVDLENNNSYFGRFIKKVQGIALGGTFNHSDDAKTSAFAAGALVRGVFQRSQFTGQEGNQGPYKLVGPNGELFILIVSGSERVFVNGLLLQRGENADYVIDYNAGEIKFNPTYPITSNMRISVEYQFTDRNYTRFIGYGGGNYTSEKLDLGVYVYSESDAKNQPLQQNLSEEQVDILQAAGDNMDALVAPSAVEDTFSENKILYRKETAPNGDEIFVFSNDPEDTLFSVRFSLVGDGLGNYISSDQSAISIIFEYTPPIDGAPQGNYEPIIQLNAPTKLQVGGLNGSYRPTKKTTINFEVAGSQNDLNLFSDIEDANNDGFAGRLDVRQNVFTSADTLKIDAIGSLDYVNRDFRTIERLYNIEFNRDWNLIDPRGDQRFAIGGFELNSPTVGGAQYTFQNLDFSENFSGTRHVVNSNLRFGNLRNFTSGSILDSEGDSLQSKFYRLHHASVYGFEKAWVGGKISAEDNQIAETKSNSLSFESQRFSEYEAFIGIGDSTKVHMEVGFRHRVTDSVQFNQLLKVNTANTYFLKSKLLNTANTQLSVFANYREQKPFNNATIQATEKSLNSRILYTQNILKNGVRFNTVLEANNGVLPQQEFTYTQVDPGQGIFTWIDYNNNGIQELDEFEVAQFQDQADYVRILLPNQVFIKIRENKFSQILTLDPQNWANRTGFLKVLSTFHNQTSYVLNRKVRRNDDGFNLNPFLDGNEDQLGLNLNFRNALFFNRGKQKFTTGYTYIATSANNLLSVGLQSNKLENHQVSFNHKFWESWLLNLRSAAGNNESTSESFPGRNFFLDSYEVNPKISYLLNRSTRFDVFYQFMNEENTLGALEQLNQQKIGTSFSYTNAQKISLNGEFTYIDNAFTGSAFSPVAYQMLEGLQPGTNFTWSLLLQKRITKYLDANLSYFGRKSKDTKTVHTGSIQLRAYF
jgi:hypothetical protein